MSRSSISVITNDLARALLELHNLQRISRRLYDEFSQSHLLHAIADELNQKGEYETIDHAFRFEQIAMKAINGSEFPFVRILLKSDLTQIPKYV